MNSFICHEFGGELESEHFVNANRTGDHAKNPLVFCCEADVKRVQPRSGQNVHGVHQVRTVLNHGENLVQLPLFQFTHLQGILFPEDVDCNSRVVCIIS